MGILNFLFGNKRKLPYNKTVEFKRIVSDFEIEVGDKLNLWNKPNTNQINLYAKGSIDGSGLVGYTNNSTIRYHLSKTKFLFTETKVVKLTNNQIFLDINMFADQEAVIENQKNQRIKWIDLVQKKYSPKTNWELRFFSDIPITMNNLKIATISKDQISEYYHRKDETIWLTDKNDVKLDAENRIREGGTEKTLRSVFSGHELEIKKLEKDYNWYYLEVGVKDSYV